MSTKSLEDNSYAGLKLSLHEMQHAKLTSSPNEHLSDGIHISRHSETCYGLRFTWEDPVNPPIALRLIKIHILGPVNANEAGLAPNFNRRLYRSCRLFYI